MNTPIKELKTKGFVSLEYPKDLREAVSDMVEAWEGFCALPTGVKKGLPYSNNADGVGYEIKEGTGPKGDKKENFDVTLSGKEWLKTNASSIKNAIALYFIEKTTTLVGIMKPTIIAFAEQAEKEFGIKDFAQEVSDSEAAFFIRFIHYFGDRAPGDETASAHVDQSGFTLHLFESAPGLQCLTHEKEWIDMPVSEGETVIIPCMQMQLRSEGKLRALCHRVIATPETAEDGRYSAVCFVQFKNTLKYDKERCGRLQERKPGFNYSMPLEQFQDLFKK